MYGSMVDIQSTMTEKRRGKKIEERRRNDGGKTQCPHLLHRAAI